MFGLDYATSGTGNQLDQVRCKCCDLYHEKDLTDCPHCSQLDDTQLQTPKSQVAVQDKLNSRLGQNLLLALVVVILLIMLFNVF